MRISGNPDNIIGVSLHSIDDDATAFFEKEGYTLNLSLRGHEKTAGWAGRLTEGRFWGLVDKAYTEGFAVMLIRRTLPASDSDGNLPLHCLRLDSNVEQFGS